MLKSKGLVIPGANKKLLESKYKRCFLIELAKVLHIC